MRSRLKKMQNLILAAILFVPFLSKAEVKLPSVFGDNMVLQQNTDARLWGWADANEQIKVITSWGKGTEIEADENGKWAVEIPTPSGSYTPHMIILKGENEVYLRNILIGEVWLCSGQSNMGFPVRQSVRAYDEVRNANNKSIRFFHIPTTLAWKPQEDVEAQWAVCTPESTANESAVAYYFGKKLIEELEVPIGLIVSAWGGSGAQAWIDRKTAGQEGQQDIVDWYDANEPKLREYRFEWIKNAALWRAQQKEGEDFDWDSRPKRNLPGDQHIPFALYNGMINPVKTYSMKGAIWYQGESNVQRANQYRTLFPAMIKSWRNAWNLGDFPFYFVQIGSYHYNDYEGVKSSELRDAQLKTLDISKNTGMVVITDVADVNDIHPRKKIEVGNRLALLALHNDYRKIDGEYCSPFYKSHEIEGNSIIVSVSHAKELKARGVELVGFTISGKDQVFVNAKAEIVNENQLKIWSDKVKKPVAVRFGWTNALVTNLFNEIMLPLSPFKTDNWKDTTEGNIHLDFP